MKNMLKRQIMILEKKEAKILNKKENQFIKTKLTPLMDKIEEMIPDKLRNALNLAFYKGFKLVFEKGTIYIEKTYNKEKIQIQYDINNYAAEKTLSKKSFKNIDKQSNISTKVNSSISVLEGTALGLLGIGLPDIPLFISVIMKTIYEVALSYGFDYESDIEKKYILLIICASMTNGSEQKEYNHQIEMFEKSMNENVEIEGSLEEQMKITAKVLSDAMVTAKFIQGFAIIGAVGGVINHSIVRKIGEFAVLKYKKRYIKNMS